MYICGRCFQTFYLMIHAAVYSIYMPAWITSEGSESGWNYSVLKEKASLFYMHIFFSSSGPGHYCQSTGVCACSTITMLSTELLVLQKMIGKDTCLAVRLTICKAWDSAAHSLKSNQTVLLLLRQRERESLQQWNPSFKTTKNTKRKCF